MAPRGRAHKAKIVKKEVPHDELTISKGYALQPQLKPSVEIMSCISFQKFRYSGENRPGKKYQEKEFMTLKLSNLQDKVVRVVIICTDADNRELIHPNGLQGKDCHDGIYDKEYAVTKSQFLIKIPYLRTERIKTKKNEHEKIQSVLSERASHLPSPYKERCLSQCTDKYTSSRKFNTTKVCLGVIVTVQSHQGAFNGSLHAISHVVKNASEKTQLDIIKLSNVTVPAMTGGVIDIFTNEDGPEIEPEKYLVYVTCDPGLEGVDSWISPKMLTDKSNILYKKVISYTVPPYEPNPNLTTSIQAVLHLECPQSNQRCDTLITYMPQGEIVVLDESGYEEQKRMYLEDMKPAAKRKHEGDGNTDNIKAKMQKKINVKAGLKTKIQARQDTQNSSGVVYMDEQSNSQDGVNHHYIIQQPQLGSHLDRYSQDQSVIVSHEDPNTGETFHFLDMDGNKSTSHAVLDGENQQYTTVQLDKNSTSKLLKNVRGKDSPYQSHSEDIVYTGYSEAVPPNTTVLIYTTKEGISERVVVDKVSGQQVVYHDASDDDHSAARHSPNVRHGGKQISVLGSSAPASMQNGSSEQIIRRESIQDKITASHGMSHYGSEAYNGDNQRLVTQSYSDHVQTSEARHLASRPSQSAGSVNDSSSVGSSAPERYSPVPTSSSGIPPLRRMLIPNKAMPSASPWEVDTREDSSSDYHMLGYPYESVNDHMPGVKREPADDDSLIQRNHIASTPVSVHNSPRYIAEKRIDRLEEARQNQDHSGEGEASVAVSTSIPASKPETTSTDDLSTAIAENLPTAQVFAIAESLADDYSSNMEEENMGTSQSH